jgi:probable phosphoglycerate mutase
VAAAHGLDVSVLDGIHEVGVGELEGRSDKDAVREFFHTYAAWVAGDEDRPMPGGETAKQVLARYTEAVCGIRAAHPQGAVLLVSHGAVIRLAAPALSDNVQGELGEHALLPNTGRVVLEAGDTASSYHCVEWSGVDLS